MLPLKGLKKRAEKKEIADELKEDDEKRLDKIKKKDGMDIIKHAQDIGTI